MWLCYAGIHRDGPKETSRNFGMSYKPSGILTTDTLQMQVEGTPATCNTISPVTENTLITAFYNTS